MSPAQRRRRAFRLSAALGFLSVVLTSVSITCYQLHGAGRRLAAKNRLPAPMPNSAETGSAAAEAEALQERIAQLEARARLRASEQEERLALAHTAEAKANTALERLAEQRRLLQTALEDRDRARRAEVASERRARRANAEAERYREALQPLREEVDRLRAQRSRSSSAQPVRVRASFTLEPLRTVPPSLAAEQDSQLAFWVSPTLVIANDGNLVERNEEAASAGDSEAMYQLSLHYQGLGDSKATSVWVSRAARAGHPLAQFTLGRKLVRRSATRDQGLEFLEKAAQAGVGAAHNELGVLLVSLPAPQGNPERGEQLLRLAAGAGHPLGMANLGALLASGRGKRSNPAEAEFWLRKAARAGVPVAKTNLDLLLGALESR